MDARASLLSVLDSQLASRLSFRFGLIVPVMCGDEDSLEYVRRHESSFVFHARELLLSRVAGPDCAVKVSLGYDNRLQTVVTNNASVLLWSTGKVLLASGWNHLAGNVVERLEKSFTPTVSLRVSRKAVFEILNKMVGNEPLAALSAAVEAAVSEARASSGPIVEKAVAEFVAKERVSQMKRLERFVRENLSHDVLSEDDLLQSWRERLVSDIMDD